MITAFAGSKAAEGFYYHVHWRWGFGCFAIIVPAVTLPLFFMLKLNLRKAKTHGVISEDGDKRSVFKIIWDGVIGFDGK